VQCRLAPDNTFKRLPSAATDKCQVLPPTRSLASRSFPVTPSITRRLRWLCSRTQGLHFPLSMRSGYEPGQSCQDSNHVFYFQITRRLHDLCGGHSHRGSNVKIISAYRPAVVKSAPDRPRSRLRQLERYSEELISCCFCRQVPSITIRGVWSASISSRSRSTSGLCHRHAESLAARSHPPTTVQSRVAGFNDASAIARGTGSLWPLTAHRVGCIQIPDRCARTGGERPDRSFCHVQHPQNRQIYGNCRAECIWHAWRPRLNGSSS
jgi:hypothetical protein